MESYVRYITVVAVTIGVVCVLFLPSLVCAEPSKAQVINFWELQNRVQGRVLDVKSRGGQRSTNELDGKHYLNPVGTCVRWVLNYAWQGSC